MLKKSVFSVVILLLTVVSVTCRAQTAKDTLQKWVALRFEYRPYWEEIWKWVLVAGGVVAIVLGLTIYWNRRLAGEVARQKQTERALQESEAEYKRITEALREANDNLESLFNHANAPIIVWCKSLRITRFNRAFETLTGRVAADVIGRHISLLFPPVEMERCIEMIDRAIAGERWEVVEIPIKHVNGSVRTVLWNSATIFATDGTTPVATIAQGQDITELRAHILKERRLEELIRIREAVECEERSRLARELHDGSGQSLQAIRLHLKLLAAGKGGGNLSQDLDQLAQEVADTATELREISHQLRPSYLTEVNLDVAVFRRCEMLRQREVPVSANCYGDFSGLPLTISNNLYRIFQEALVNAVHHAAASHIKVYLNRSHTALRLIVSDDGSGICLDESSEGIGMRIMKERAELIDAMLDIESSPRGTTITVNLGGV
jgi:PAS domain S-box-containing protein